MKRTGSIFVIGLLTLFFAAAGVSLANAPTSLTGTTWSGDITSMAAGGTATTSSTLSITFSFDSGTYPDFLSGTFTEGTGSAVSFSAMRNGRSISITAVGYSIDAEMTGRGHAEENCGHSGHHGGNSTATFYVTGKNLTDGSSFEGTLTESQS